MLTIAIAAVAAAVFAPCASAQAPSMASDCFFQDLGDTSGAAWTVLSSNRSVAVAASVPGQVHLDLMRAGLIGDPYADNATLAQQWVRDEAWTFERGFEADERLAACAHILLVADGLDTLATVVLDGAQPQPWTPTTELQNQIPADRLNFTATICVDGVAALLRRCAAACAPPCVGFTTGNPAPSACCWLYSDVTALQNSTDGNWWPAPPAPPRPTYSFDAEDMFLRYSWDVTAAIAVDGATTVAAAAAHNISVAFRSVSGTSWPSIRKEADSWGYDWAPVTQTQGIWQPLALVGVNSVAITHVVPRIRAVPDNPTAPLADSNNSFECSVDVVLLLPAPASISVEAVGAWGTRSATTLSLPAGESTVTLVLGAENVPLWWPHTHGAQVMFDLSVTATAAGALVGAAASRRVGFRSVALVANASSTPLRQFYRVNGVELFVMGADWVPADAFQARLDESRLRDLLQSVVAANMNILRVWGGGIYNPDLFYNICDELGIMVHSEGQFSDGDYEDSADAARLALVAAEALHQARRLATHPSLIVWVGNNENAPPSADPSNWVNFYLRHFLDVVAAADSSRPVWPLCPAFPWEAGVDAESGLPNGDPLQLSRTGYSGPPWEGHVYFFDLCSTPETCGNCVDDSITNCSALVVHVGSELLAPVNATLRLEAVRFSDGGGGSVAEWPAPLAGPGSGLFFDVPSTAQLVALAGCASLADCLVLVRAIDATSGAELRPPALRSLTLWADAALPAVSVSITSLGGGNFSIAAEGGVAPHTMLHAETLGHFLPNNLLLKPGQPVATSWVPGPGGAAEPHGVYAVSINGGSASLAASSWARGAARAGADVHAP